MIWRWRSRAVRWAALTQGIGPEPIDAPLRVDAGLDQAGVPQDLEVLGDGGLAQ
jgi:hypothetical protein